MSEDNQGLAKSRACKITKIDLVVDSFAWPTGFDITGPEVGHGKAAAELMAKWPGRDDTMVDKGEDSEGLRNQMKTKGYKRRY